MLLLLGDQLIRDQGLAVFELVKNSYDADASLCTVTMHDVEHSQNTRIVVEDDGMGMSPEIVKTVWLEPGTDYRAKQRRTGQRSKKFHRLPLGEKGVGRFAAHKLGNRITLVTKSKEADEVVVEIDWERFAEDAYLDQVPITIETRSPKVFVKGRTGTRLEISGVRAGEAWTRGKLRDLHRAVTSIRSPFQGPTDFDASLRIIPPNDWLEGLLDVSTVLELSLFRATGVIERQSLRYKYEFRPLPGMPEGVRSRTSEKTLELMLPGRRPARLDLGDHSIGPIQFDFHIFDREPAVLALLSDRAGLKKYLDNNGGVRVYRDGVRVFDFGEPGNDWLDLGGRRVNAPAIRISNNQIVGAASLSGPVSSGLIEKTNREGFIENDAYQAFRFAVLAALANVEAERRQDKEELRRVYSRASAVERPVVDEIAELRLELEKRAVNGGIARYVDRIERQFLSVQETLLTAAGSGLTLTTIIHEVEKVIKELLRAVRKHAPRDRLLTLVEHLDKMVDGLAFLTRKSGNTLERASILIQQALFNTEYRLRAHKVVVVNGLSLGNPDFEVKCVRRLIVSTLMNLIDNAIYWLEATNAPKKLLYIGTSTDLPGGPALIVADNGPGLVDPAEYLVQPFFSRKPDGMGLGLHLASEVARLHHGALLFPKREDVGLSDDLSGAIIALQLGGKS